MFRPALAAPAFALSVLAFSLASPAFAQEEAATPGADEYTQRVQAGIALVVAGDPTGAMAAFRDAIGLDATRPQAPYYLAAANRVAGNLEEALTGFQRAAELAEQSPRWRGRALQAVAATLERISGRIEDARTAWQAYVRFADSNATVTHPQLGRARIQALDVMNEQEQAYVAVRERIAQREREVAAAAREESRPRRRRRR